MSAVGIGYGTNSDRAHAITRQVIGNGSIVARITAASVEAGVGIRDSMHRYSRRAKLVWSASGQTLRFRPRVTSNTTDTATSIAGLALPLWVKLESVEATDTITASYAADVAGAPGAWITIGAPTVIAMDATADYSLTADSGSDTVAAAATFDHLALTPVPVGPAVLAEDFGDGTQAGTYSYVSGTDTHTLQGQGSLDGSGMFWGQQFAGDFILTVLQLDDLRRDRCALQHHDSRLHGQRRDGFRGPHPDRLVRVLRLAYESEGRHRRAEWDHAEKNAGCVSSVAAIKSPPCTRPTAAAPPAHGRNSASRKTSSSSPPSKPAFTATTREASG